MEARGIDVAAIPQTAMRVLTAPAAFFREMPKTGGFVEPLVFMAAMGVVGGILQAILMIVGLHVAAGITAALASVVLVPVMVVIFGFVGAAIIFLIWKFMGSGESYETAYRCAAYISAVTPITTLLGIIPYIGAVIGVVLTMYFLVIASVEVHGIPSQKAWLVFGIIGAIFVLFSISSQMAARRMASQAIKLQREMEEAAKTLQKQSEEIKRSGERMQKQMEQQTEEARKAAEEMQKQLEEMQKQTQKK